MPIAKKKGLTVQTFNGLNKSRMEKKSSGFGSRLQLKPGETTGVQFLSKPEDFTEFETHSWSDGSRWNFVPCAGDECPLCMDEDSDKRKKSYRFACLVYSFRDKAVKVLEGPKDLAGRIFFRYERKPAMFTKRTYEITKLATTPVSYDFAVGEDDLMSAVTLKTASAKVSVDEYLELELKAFYGNDLPVADKSSLVSDPDDDEDEIDLDDDEDETEEDAVEVSYSLGDLRKMKIAQLRTIAEELDIDIEDLDKTDLIEAIVEAGDEDEDSDEEDEPEDDEDSDDEEDEDEEDEDEDDEDEEDDEEDEDEDEEPAPAKRPVKKAVARRR